MIPATLNTRAATLIAALCLFGAWPLVAAAQTEAPSLAIHGFMTQAYGRSNQRQVLGIGRDGTADYRVAALQFRYDLDDANTFVLQFSHERLGRSRLAALEPEVAVDWAFIEHRFGDYTTVRAGKVKNPVGIFNEIRDVGTLLPLYRPPATFYSEQVFTGETMNGVTVARRLPLGSWEVSAEGYFGSWDYVQLDQQTRARIDAGYGVQLWVHTPLENVRVGGAVGGHEAEGMLFSGGRDDPQMFLTGSLDSSFGPLTARGEFAHYAFGDAPRGWDGHLNTYYGQLVYALTDRFDLVGQGEWLDFRLSLSSPFPMALDENIVRSFVAGVRYTPSPFLVLKAEGHRYHGYDIEDPNTVIGVNDRVNINFMLVSVSVSF